MRLDEMILLTLYYNNNDRMIAGRTLLQKTLYFVNEKLKLGFEFVSHYYGPYSTAITSEIESLKASGIVREEVQTFPSFSFGVTFEPRKYMYCLTTDGTEIAKLVELRKKVQAEKIKQIIEDMRSAAGVSDDYKSLSVAAKMHHILKFEKKPMTPSDILREAETLGWNMALEDATSSMQFLKSMGFIKVRKPKK